jgi:hypothetical protein
MEFQRLAFTMWRGFVSLRRRVHPRDAPLGASVGLEGVRPRSLIRG